MITRSRSSIVATLLVSAALAGCAQSPTSPSAAVSNPTATVAAAASASNVAATASRFGNRTPGVVYVTSQGLYYDTFVVKDPLPMNGPFQLLSNGETEFGPGQAGYVGGRWWEDLNQNGIQDPDDHYFLCPLIPPGRSTP